MRAASAVLLAWPARRWVVALAATAVLVLVVAVPTDLVDTPVFGREIPPTWWAWLALLASSLLGGLLTATYVRAPSQPDRASSRRGRSAVGSSASCPAGPPRRASRSALGTALRCGFENTPRGIYS